MTNPKEPRKPLADHKTIHPLVVIEPPHLSLDRLDQSPLVFWNYSFFRLLTDS